jgi:pantoate--beta-alanine ligase
MKLARTAEDVRAAVRAARELGQRVGLVPTMGAFHAGHLSLIAEARSATDFVVVSLFVNPTQFTSADDLERYPRDEPRDANIADEAGVDLLFAPEPEALYPPGFDTRVDPGELGSILEGAHRPGHFIGVATVCTKLFSIVQPDVAWFGQKDAQQVAVIRHVVEDLDIHVAIRVAPIVRDADGLALSSRNRSLSSEERRGALALPRALAAGAAAHRAGGDPARAAREILEGADGVTVDYVQIASFDVPTLVAAVRVGPVRLIDNARLEP